MPPIQAVLRRFIPICLLLALVTVTAIAGEDVRTLSIAVNKKTVEILDRNGQLVQALPIDGEIPNAANKEYFALIEDMNFDGFPDVRVLFSQGIVNIYYDCWLWNPEKNAFVRNEAMRDLSSPNFDQASKTVHVYERVSAVCHVEGELIWENGELVWQTKTEQDIADRDGYIVVRQYRRENGELRLVGEETKCVEEELGSACLVQEFPGFNLFIEFEGETLDSAIFPNGEWWLWRASDDRSVMLESRRIPAMEYEEDVIYGLIRREWPEAYEIKIEPFEAMAEKLTYPVFKATFLNGTNEDTRVYSAALVLTDEWSFWFVANASDHDDAALEDILLQAEIVEPDDGEFIPDSGPRVYHSYGDDSSLDISVLEALIMIKKTVGPERSQWIDGSNVAYRYDEYGTIGTMPALLFSFGADRPEKFTAERHFAVDETGAVYEMDIERGGEYWKWDNASWWGNYQKGDMTFVVQNYREGPSGMYFMFKFAVGEKIVFEDLAIVRGRKAYSDALVFSLAEDDCSVDVAISADYADDSEENIFPALEGIYSAE